MSEIFQVKQNVIDWLLEEDNPPIRYLTLERITNGLENSAKITSLKSAINTYSPIVEILKYQKEKTYWLDKSKDKNYSKYLGTYWQIHFLSELYAQKTEAIGNAIEHLFSTGQAPNGGFSVTGTDSGSIVCLTSNIFRALVHFGYLNDERTQIALNFILDRIVDTKGIIHCGDTFSLVTSCYMTLPKVLLALSSIPKSNRSSRVTEGIDICVKRLLENKIYKYIPEKNKEWMDYFGEQGFKGKQIFEERDKFLTRNPSMGKIAKAGWMKFGFPLSYNSDALEVMYALATAEISYSPEMHDALELIKTKSQADRWINEKKFQSKMYAEIEPYQQASKWLTYRALYVLKFYQQLSIQD